MDIEADKHLADNVRKLLRSGFANNKCLTLGQCAESLEISARSMQRRLRTIGVTFSTLIDEVRYDLAKDKLLHSHDTIEEIAKGLGFSTQESFIRAFYRWSSISPGQFRREGHV